MRILRKRETSSSPVAAHPEQSDPAPIQVVKTGPSSHRRS